MPISSPDLDPDAFTLQEHSLYDRLIATFKAGHPSGTEFEVTGLTPVVETLVIMRTFGRVRFEGNKMIIK